MFQRARESHCSFPPPAPPLGDRFLDPKLSGTAQRESVIFILLHGIILGKMGLGNVRTILNPSPPDSPSSEGKYEASCFPSIKNILRALLHQFSCPSGPAFCITLASQKPTSKGIKAAAVHTVTPQETVFGDL